MVRVVSSLEAQSHHTNRSSAFLQPRGPFSAGNPLRSREHQLEFPLLWRSQEVYVGLSLLRSCHRWTSATFRLLKLLAFFQLESLVGNTLTEQSP